MTKHYPLLPLLVLVAFIFSSCTKSIKIVSFPEGELSRKATINFVFSEPIAPKDSIGKWLRGDYLQFEPEIEGFCRFNSQKELSFIPKQAYPEGKQIVVKPGPALHFGKKIKIKAPEISFSTIPFKPIELQSKWKSPNTDSYSFYPIELSVSFNEKVDPWAIRDHLKIKINGEEYNSPSFQTYSSTKTIDLLLDYDKQAMAPIYFEVQVLKGLEIDEGKTILVNDFVLLDTLEPMDKLVLSTPKMEMRNGQNYLIITANQALNAETVRPYLALVPDMPFEVSQEDASLRISADFRPNGMYTVLYKEGMHGKAGGVLKNDDKHNITFPGRQPFLKFADEKGHYLMRNGFENLNVKACNINAVAVDVYEIYENNLLHFLRANPSDFSRWSHYDTEEEYYYENRWGYLSLDEFGGLMMTDTLKLLTDKAHENEIQDLRVKIKENLRSKFQGIYAVSINSIGGEYMDDYKIVSLSDVGIIARWTRDDLLVFVNRLSTTAPAAGTRVNLISTTNQAMRSGIADGNGFIKFENVGRDEANKFHPRLITTQLGSDFNFLDLNRSQIDHYRYELDGKERRDYEIYAYPDRNLYRPGDTLHLGAIVRNWYWETAKGLPIDAIIRNPNGKAIHEARIPTDEQGGLELNFPIPYDAPTGRYYAEVKYDYASMHEFGFQVEDFVPDKIEVRLNVDKPSGQPGDTFMFPIAAQYYFGAPCADHRYEGKFRLNVHDFRSAKYPDFNFSSSTSYMAESWEKFDGKLDSTGRDTISFEIPEQIEQAGIATGFCHLSVFDNTGHPVHARKAFAVATRPNFIGFRSHGNYFNIHDNFQIDYITTSFADQAVKGIPMELEVLRYEWNNSLRMDNYGNKFVSEKEAIVVRRDTIQSKGQIEKFQMRMEIAGNYRFRIRFLDGSLEKIHHFSAYGQAFATSTSFGVRQEGTVDIQFDKSSYEVGETARILFTAPFSGKMLVTMEREGVYAHRYLNVENGAAELRIPIQSEFLPNVIVTATLFRPQRNGRQLPLTVAHGFASIKIDQSNRHLPIKIIAPERSKPGQMQRITIQTNAKANTNVTVAVVDEGILAIKHFATPDAYPVMYAARELEVVSADMYGYLLPEVPSGEAATGGSDGSNWTSYPHLNPVRSRRYRPFAWWSGIEKTNARGQVVLDVPMQAEFNGLARIMVMAYDGNKFGSAAQHMVVREDLVVMPAIPRFLTLGDTMSIPISIMNLTEKAGEVELKITAEGAVKTLTKAPLKLSLDGKGNGNLSFKLEANKIGEGKITLQTDGLKQVSQTVYVPVRPASNPQKYASTGAIAGGKKVAILIPNDFNSEFNETQIQVSRFQALEFGDDLEYLLAYPHGCLEQTVSKAFPQIYFGELAAIVAPKQFKNSNSMHHVREAIQKIETMQNYDGDFSYWPGDRYANGNRWASIYATHFLVEAQKAGFAIQKDVLEQAISKCKEYAQDNRKERYYYYENNVSRNAERTPQEVIYALYVLALSGNADISLMNYHKSSLDLLTEDSKYLLAASYAIKKDQKSFEEILPKTWKAVKPVRLSAGSFDSPIRSAAIILNALVEADPSHPRILDLINYINQHRKEIYSTQDRAWTFMGIGKAIQRNRFTDLKISVNLDNSPILEAKGESKNYVANDLGGKTIEFKAEGEGVYYYRWTHQGYQKDAGVKVLPVEKHLRVKRTWYNTEGQAIANRKFYQGQLVVCQIEIASDTIAPNISVIDMIPAGFEVENTRLNSNDYSWIKQQHQSENLDVRDDRVNTFMSFQKPDSKKFQYLVRATNTGMFLQPAIFAESMYDPNIQSQKSGDTVWVHAASPLDMHGNKAKAFATEEACPESLSSGKTVWQKFMNSLQLPQ